MAAAADAGGAIAPRREDFANHAGFRLPSSLSGKRLAERNDDSMSTQQPVSRRRLSVATQVFIGLGLGLLVGVFFAERVAFLRIGGDIVGWLD
jgi:hypothetical protein